MDFPYPGGAKVAIVFVLNIYFIVYEVGNLPHKLENFISKEDTDILNVTNLTY